MQKPSVLESQKNGVDRGIQELAQLHGWKRERTVRTSRQPFAKPRQPYLDLSVSKQRTKRPAKSKTTEDDFGQSRTSGRSRVGEAVSASSAPSDH